jgi:hypothetical protein
LNLTPTATGSSPDTASMRDAEAKELVRQQIRGGGDGIKIFANSIERDDILTMPLDLAQVIAAEAHRAGKSVFAHVFFSTVPMLGLGPTHPLYAPRNAGRLAPSAFWRPRPQSGQRHKMQIVCPGTKSVSLRTLLKNQQECLE